MAAAATTEMMEGLILNVQADSRPRPLLFVGHSLGGLVIKEVGSMLLQHPHFYLPKHVLTIIHSSHK